MRTMREELRVKKHQQLVGNIADLLEKNIDAEKGYKKALVHAKRKNLKLFLKTQAFLHARFATELDQHLRYLNERPINHRSILGSFHRAWMDVAGLMEKSADRFILQECIRGEKVAISEYREKLDSGKFPPLIKLLLQGQVVAMEKSIEGMATLDDLP